MPNPEPKLVDLYSVDDIKGMPIIAGTVLFGILGDTIPQKEKEDLLKQVSTYDIIQNNPDYAAPVYGVVLPGFTAEFKGENDAFHVMDRLNSQRKEIPADNYYTTLEMSATNHLGDSFEEVVRYMTDPFKKMSIYLDNYLKTAVISDDEKEFVKSYKTVVDNIAQNKGHSKELYKNPAFFTTQRYTGAMMNVETVSANLEVKDEKTNTIGFVIKDNAKKGGNWKKSVLTISNSPIMDMIKGGNKLNEDQAAFEIGNLSRAGLKKSYQNYVNICKKQFSMSEEEFKKIHDKGGLQNNYDNFVKGSRTNNYAQYDAEARIKLIDAGYPMSDIPAMAQFYVAFQEVRRRNNLREENASAEIENECRAMEEVWNSVVNAPTKANTLNLNSRKEGIGKLSDYTKSIIDRIKKGDIPKDTFIGDKTITAISTAIENRKNAELELNDKLALSGNIKGLYNAIKGVDPSYVISSSEFRAMKNAIEKLSKTDKAENPAKYELLRDEAIAATKKYIDMKGKELNESNGKHKRSELEAKRVNLANTIYNRLNQLKEREYYRAAAKDKRFVVDENMSFKNAKAFIRAQRILDYGKKQMISNLQNIAAVLANTQEDKKHNFNNTEEMEGSISYKLMTQSLQLAINRLKNPNSSPDSIRESLIQFHKCAAKYQVEHKGFLFGPREWQGKFRLEMSESAVTDVPTMLNCYDNMIREFAPVKDENGKSYMEMTYAEIEKKSLELESLHEKEMISSTIIRHVDSYENIYEVSGIQLQLRKLIREKNSFMGSNYRSNYKSDMYVAMRDGAGASDLASDFVAKKYFDKIYKVGVKADELYKIEEELKNGTYDMEVSKLQKNSVFKAVVKGYPERVFSKWESVERKADAIQKSCQDKLDANLTHRGEYSNQGEYLVSNFEGELNHKVASVMVNQSIASKSGRIVAEAIAADVSVKADDVINNLIIKETETLDKKSSYLDRNGRDRFGRKEYDGEVKDAETMQKYLENSANKKNVFNRILNNASTSLKDNEAKRINAIKVKKQSNVQKKNEVKKAAVKA